MLVVIAIIAILVAVVVPSVSNRLETTRETTDMANVRSAYAQVQLAAVTQDTDSPSYWQGTYQLVVDLVQTRDGWSKEPDTLNLGGIAPGDKRWKGSPKAKGRCRVYFIDGELYINWGGEDHINQISSKDFLSKEILKEILGDKYNFSVINSNEKYEAGGGTQKFIDYVKEHGFDLADYDAATWQIYVKSGSSYLDSPAIYWSTLTLSDAEVGKKVPVMGYRDGKYDVYYADVVKYNKGTANEYVTLKNNFANITNSGGTATFQFESYEEARAAYDKILAIYNEKGVLTGTDLANNGLMDKK